MVAVEVAVVAVEEEELKTICLELKKFCLKVGLVSFPHIFPHSFRHLWPHSFRHL